MKNCVSCAQPTRRRDGYCPNCYQLGQTSTMRNCMVEMAVIEGFGNKCHSCDFTDPWALMLVRVDGHPELPGIIPPRKGGLTAKMNWAEAARADRDKFILRCLNCQDRFNPSPGRPTKFTDAQRRTRKALRDSNRVSSVAERLKAIFGDICVRCGRAGAVPRYVGEMGKGPRAGDWLRSRYRLLKDEDYRKDFAPICPFCESPNYLTLAMRGEVPRPNSWRKQA